MIRAQLGLKVSTTFNTVRITLFKGLNADYKLVIKKNFLNIFRSIIKDSIRAQLMSQYRIFGSLFFKKYAWSCQVYRKANSATREII